MSVRPLWCKTVVRVGQFFFCIIAGLFHRVIAQSGTANAMWATHVTKTKSALQKEVKQLAEGLGCYDSNYMECLKHKPWDKFRATGICEV